MFEKVIFFISVFSFVLITVYNAPESIYRPNLPCGPYKCSFKALFKCNDTINYLINHNLHFTKLSYNKTAVDGNVTFSIPFDDSLTFNVNMAVWSQIGGWKDNYFILSYPKACSSMKFFCGSTNWETLRRRLKSSDCPIKTGTYQFNSVDTDFYKKLNLPKEFFYGRYKFKLYYTNQKNDVVFCINAVFDMIRPWE
ncbi:uncharacterized protein LOC126898232 [Daktulosphaira vitifoliae]|uniref:uncharacterized protein LOC126898232 n=1 Tax=Daktulosphaira vitifoliae TaxID=58002 RepID=UPI0021AA1DCA|nr:uncharacterized protein LOC126898232 [Daktulosphaira vitifoliae]